jgi:hypothetical protein
MTDVNRAKLWFLEFIMVLELVTLNVTTENNKLFIWSYLNQLSAWLLLMTGIITMSFPYLHVNIKRESKFCCVLHS